MAKLETLTKRELDYFTKIGVWDKPKKAKDVYMKLGKCKTKAVPKGAHVKLTTICNMKRKK